MKLTRFIKANSLIASRVRTASLLTNKMLLRFNIHIIHTSYCIVSAGLCLSLIFRQHTISEKNSRYGRANAHTLMLFAHFICFVYCQNIHGAIE